MFFPAVCVGTLPARVCAKKSNIEPPVRTEISAETDKQNLSLVYASVRRVLRALHATVEGQLNQPELTGRDTSDRPSC
ncbi:hypothetical protein D3C81_2188690 [compost metagenome]